MTQLNRRSILTGAAAVPAATAVTAFPAIGLCKGVSSELIGLIEEHRAANAAFLVEVTRDDRQPGCGTLADAKVKAEYLLTNSTVSDMWDEEAKSVLESLA